MGQIGLDRRIACDTGHLTAESENYKGAWVRAIRNVCEKFPIEKGFEYVKLDKVEPAKTAQ